MNTKAIYLARDPDLRASQIAIQRAARRAREVAATTGTALIVSHNGVIERIVLNPAVARAGVQEDTAPYGPTSS